MKEVVLTEVWVQIKDRLSTANNISSQDKDDHKSKSRELNHFMFSECDDFRITLVSFISEGMIYSMKRKLLGQILLFDFSYEVPNCLIICIKPLVCGFVFFY